MQKMQVKNLLRNISHRAGYDVTISRVRDRPGASTESVLDYKADRSTSAIFEYFPSWESHFDYQGSGYGGHLNDYNSVATTILRHDKLSSTVDLAGKSVLELGPLEGGNTLLLCRAGARRIVAVEGRVENYVKCCVIKNLYEIDAAGFVLDDVRNVTVDRFGTFDIALVAGILYHLDNPLTLLRNLAPMVETLIVSTHIAGPSSPSPKAKEVVVEMDGRQYRGKQYVEGPLADPHAGLQTWSFWPYEQDLLSMIEATGFSRITVLDRPRRERNAYELIYLVASRPK